MSHGLIDPSKLPGHNLDLAGVSQAAAHVSSRGASIQQAGTDVASSWSTLPASYESTGAEAVYVAMNPVRDASDRVGGDLSSVASALTDWVSTVQPILARLADLRSDAEAFVVEANNFSLRVTWTNNLAVTFMRVPVENWWEDPDMVQRNADLVDQGYLLGEQLRVANEDLANAIRRSAGLSTSDVPPAATSAPENVQTDWGSASPREESCAEKTIGFPTHLAGGVLNGAWDLVGGLGMLVFGYDFKSWPPPAWGVAGDMLSGDFQGAADRGGEWLSGWGQSWLGLGHLVTGVSMGFMAPVMSEVVTPGQISDLKSKGVDTGFLEWQQQWTRDSYRSYIDLFGSFVGYHAPEEWWNASPDQWGEGWADWGKDPGGTAGKSAFNIASIFIPAKGGGAILDGLKGGRGAEGLGDDLGRGGAVERPSGSVSESNGLHLRAGGAADDGVRFGGARDDLANALQRSPLEDGGRLADDIRGGDRLVHPDADLPRVHAGDPDVQHFHRGDPDAPTVHHGGGDAPAPPHSTVPDGPRDDFAHRAPDAGPDHTSHLRVSDDIAAGRDPMHNGSSGVPGEWQRLPDMPVKPEDALYGQPHTHHGHASLPPHPQGNVHSGYDMVADPGAPYGRHPDGTPLTNAEYDARFVTPPPKNYDIYPPNEGAVPGTRVGYTDPQAFIRDYGAQLDRVGETDGKYLGLRPDGVPATFEERGLPLGSLGKPVFEYTLTGFLPQGFRIEISEIAHAFGRDGGGFQLLIRNGDGRILTIDELDELGVIE